MQETLSIFKNGEWLAWNYCGPLHEYVRERGGQVVLSKEDSSDIRELKAAAALEVVERDEALRMLAKHGKLEFRLIQDAQS